MVASVLKFPTKLPHVRTILIMWRPSVLATPKHIKVVQISNINVD